jgi:hypothetical protein
MNKLIVFCNLSILTLSLIAKNEKGIHLYEIGNYEEAFSSFTKSFDESNDPISARYLSLMYLKGKGIKQDYELGKLYIRLAAERGDKLSQNFLQKHPSFQKAPTQGFANNKANDKSVEFHESDNPESNKSSFQRNTSQGESEPTNQSASLYNSKLKNSVYWGGGLSYLNASDGAMMWEIPLELGTSPLKDGFGGSLGLGLGFLDLGIENMDSFFTFNIGGGISYGKSLSKNGLLSRIVPRVAANLEWEYFDNERTTEYTTGYDFRPLAYSDYYWRYYYSETTGGSFSFWNHSYELGVSVIAVEDLLFLTYCFDIHKSFGDLEDSTSNTFSVTVRSPFEGEENYYMTLSYSDSNNYFEAPMWSIFIVQPF